MKKKSSRKRGASNRSCAEPAGSAGSIAYAICDGDTLIEESSTGKLAIYYARDDAVAAFPAVKRGADEKMQAGLRICEVTVSGPRQQRPPNTRGDTRSGQSADQATSVE